MDIPSLKITKFVHTLISGFIIRKKLHNKKFKKEEEFTPA